MKLKDDFTNKLKQAKAQSKKTTGEMSSGFKKAGEFIKKFKLKILAVIAAMYVMIKVVKSLVIAYKAQEQAVARLTQALKNQNNLSKKNVKALIDQAKALQKVTQFGDEQIISGQAMLASFALNTEQIQALTPAMLDLAIMTQKTTGAQSDLESIAKLVGVALGGQAGRLVQMGIRLSEAEKKELNLADATEKVNVLLKIFQQNAGGLAEAVGGTATASIDQFKNAFGDLKEVLGELVMPALASFTTGLTKVINKLADYFKASNAKIDYDKIIPSAADIKRLGEYAKLIDEVSKSMNKEMEEGTLLVPVNDELIQ